MSRFLYRLGGSAAAHPWRTILAWVLVAATVTTAAATVGGTFQDDWDVEHARAQVGIEQLRDHFPAMGGATAQVLLHQSDGGVVPEQVLGEVYDELTRLEHVATVTPPRMSEEADTALLTVMYDVPVTDPDLMGDLEPLEGAVTAAEEAGLDGELGALVEQMFEFRRTIGPCPSSSPRLAGPARSGHPARPAGSAPRSPGCWTSARRSTAPIPPSAGTT